MDLLTYIEDIDRRNALAAKIPCNPGYLWQIATGWKGRRASTDMARSISRATAELGIAQVPLHAIRPDIWEPPAAPNAREQKGA